MKILMCTVYDAAVAAYQPPFYARSKAEASRIFSDAVNDRNSPYAKHPSDYTLYSLGTFDDKLCLVEQFDKHEKVLTALECLSQSDVIELSKIAN